MVDGIVLLGYDIFVCVLMLCTGTQVNIISECISTPSRLKSLPYHGGN
jgi:hypothetical protein